MVCPTHGASAPQVKAKAEQRAAEVEARTAFGKLSDRSTPMLDVFEGLERLAGDVWAWKEFAAEQIADLEKVRTIDSIGTEQVDARISVFERALAQCTQTLTAIGRLNIDDRKARIEERQAQAFVRALEAGLSAAGVHEDGPRERAKVAAVREMRAV